KNGAWRTATHASHLDFRAVGERAFPSGGMFIFHPFGFGHGSAKSNSEIVGEMIAAHGKCCRVAYHSARKNDDFSGASTEIQEAAAQFALVLGEASFGGGEGLEDGITDGYSGAVD